MRPNMRIKQEGHSALFENNLWIVLKKINICNYFRIDQILLWH